MLKTIWLWMKSSTESWKIKLLEAANALRWHFDKWLTYLVEIYLNTGAWICKSVHTCKIWFICLKPPPFHCQDWCPEPDRGVYHRTTAELKLELHCPTKAVSQFPFLLFDFLSPSYSKPSYIKASCPCQEYTVQKRKWGEKAIFRQILRRLGFQGK